MAEASRIGIGMYDGPMKADEGFFNFASSEYRGKLYRACYRILGNDAEAEDALQDAFLKAWIEKETFEGRSNPCTWLYRIVVNTAIDYRRRLTRDMHLMRTLRRYGPDGNSSGEERYDHDGSTLGVMNSGRPDTMYKNGQTAAAVNSALGNLNETDREALWIYGTAERGTKAQTVADFWEMRLGAAKSRIFRLKGEFSSLLEMEAMDSAPLAAFLDKKISRDSSSS